MSRTGVPLDECVWICVFVHPRAMVQANAHDRARVTTTKRQRVCGSGAGFTTSATPWRGVPSGPCSGTGGHNAGGTVTTPPVSGRCVCAVGRGRVRRHPRSNLGGDGARTRRGPTANNARSCPGARAWAWAWGPPSVSREPRASSRDPTRATVGHTALRGDPCPVGA